MRDDFTSTVDGAAAHAAWHGGGYDLDDDRPSLADVAEPPGPRPPAPPMCRVTRVRDGMVTGCTRRAHGDEVQHEPNPWAVPVEWITDPPF